MDMAGLFRDHALTADCLTDRERRLPWGLFAGVLERLEVGLGGPLALEQFGAELAAAHPLFRLLGNLHFGLPEIQQVAAERLLVNLFDGVVRPLVTPQTDGAMRITLSIERERRHSYPFWSLVLGMWRPLPRLFNFGDAHVEVEMADHFAEFLVIFPPDSTAESSEGQEIRRRVRESLIRDLIRYEELLELPAPDLGTSVLERRVGAAILPSVRVAKGLDELLEDIRFKLKVERVQLFEMTQTGLKRVSTTGAVLTDARIRRVLWLGGVAVGAIEIERPAAAGRAREASLLDEFIDGFAYRFAEIQQRLPFGASGGGFASTEPEVGDPSTAEPPPSSRGRLARAAREGRLQELTEEWQLSDRQRSVLALLVDGLGNREIAMRLGCSIGTIENHVTRLLKRAAVDNRAALTATFWKNQRR